jgi:hypothetical protein
MKFTQLRKIGMFMGVLGGSSALYYRRKQLNQDKGNLQPTSGKLGFFDKSNCHCNETIPPEFRLPRVLSGKDYTLYDPKMDAVYGKEPLVFEELFKQHVADYNNISGSIIHFPSGNKHVYRSAMLAYSPETLKELMQERGVTTIFHLSNKKTVNQKAWTDKEKEYFFSQGGKPENYIHILDFDYVFNDEDELFGGQKKVAEIIRQIEKSEGNVLIHCLGGEHKTELIFEIMQKHYNHVPMDNIITRYKCHTAWSADHKLKSGYKQNNVDFIQDYPSELLNKPTI